MPGTNLNLNLPSLSDSLATIVSKTATALSAIQNDLTPKVTAGELNVNTALPFNGNAATGLGSIQLVSGNSPTAAGSVYYLNGEFYAIDATGVIQLTLNGAINASGIGGIVGDYGGVNPARVTYVSASHQYQFTSSPGVWADIVAGHVILEGANGTVQLGVDNAITTATQVNYKSFPSSGVSVMVYNAATSTVEDGGVTTVTNPLTSTAAIKGSVLRWSTGRQLNMSPGRAVKSTSSATLAFGSGGGGGSPTKWTFVNDANTNPISFPLALPNGAQVTSYGCRAKNNSGATKSIHVRILSVTDGVEADYDAGNSSGYGYSIGNTATATTFPTFAVSTAVVDSTKAYNLIIYTDGASAFDVFWAYVTYVIP